jgi:hypothetical protein
MFGCIFGRRFWDWNSVIVRWTKEFGILFGFWYFGGDLGELVRSGMRVTWSIERVSGTSGGDEEAITSFCVVTIAFESPSRTTVVSTFRLLFEFPILLISYKCTIIKYKKNSRSYLSLVVKVCEGIGSSIIFCETSRFNS